MQQQTKMTFEEQYQKWNEKDLYSYIAYLEMRLEMAEALFNKKIYDNAIEYYNKKFGIKKEVNND